MGDPHFTLGFDLGAIREAVMAGIRAHQRELHGKGQLVFALRVARIHSPSTMTFGLRRLQSHLRFHRFVQAQHGRPA